MIRTFINYPAPDKETFEKLREILEKQGAKTVQLKDSFVAYTKAGNIIEVCIKADAKIENLDMYLRNIALDDRL